MPNKIIVPTDFSANSKSGIRFAIQLATQTNSTLVFYHCMEIIKPVRWTNAEFKKYTTNQLNKTTAYLNSFVEKCYDQVSIVKGKYECVVERGSDPKKSLIKYAVTVNASAICMGTRGAGKIKRVIGTNSSGVLSTSPIPVFVIPTGYRSAPIKDILYASDLGDFKSEIKRVKEFSSSLNGNIYVYHYTDKLQDPETRRKLLSIQQSQTKPGVSFIFDAFDDQSFAENFEHDLKKSKASLGVLFTNQKRNWYGKLFQPSNSAEVSFNTKVPILVFAKA